MIHIFREDLEDFAFYFIHSSVKDNHDVIFVPCDAVTEHLGKDVLHVKDELKGSTGVLNLVGKALVLGYNMCDPRDSRRALVNVKKLTTKERVLQVDKQITNAAKASLN